MDKKILIIVAGVLVLGIAAYLLLSGGYGSKQTSTTSLQEPSDTKGSVTQYKVEAIDQKPGSEVTISSTAFIDSGFVVIHEDVDGKPGPVIGNSALIKGAENNVTVGLTRATKDGEILYAMLHKDDGDGTYEFSGDDTPVQDASGDIILSKFNINDGAKEVEKIPAEINMTAGNFFFSPKSTSAKIGEPITINISNSGTHTFTIDEFGVNTNLTKSSETVTFTPSKSGNFEYYCAVPGHRENGMVGTLSVQ